MNRSFLFLIVFLALLVLVGSQCLFYVPENQRALVLRLGEAIEPTARMPGLNFKLPFVQSVVFFENRIMVFEAKSQNSLTSDMKALEIDNYICWRISDPLTFYRSLRSEQVATDRLDNIVYSQLRNAIGSKSLNEVVNTKRNEIMDEVLRKVTDQAREYGVLIVDVRIKRTDLPNRAAIFNRMNAERERMANQYRSEGDSEKLRIQSEAEKERDIILAKANRESIVTRGEADANAIRIYVDALSKDPEFYEFSKSLDVYRQGFKDNSKIIFSSDDPLLKFLN